MQTDESSWVLKRNTGPKYITYVKPYQDLIPKCSLSLFHEWNFKPMSLEFSSSVLER